MKNPEQYFDLIKKSILNEVHIVNIRGNPVILPSPQRVGTDAQKEAYANQASNNLISSLQKLEII